MVAFAAEFDPQPMHLDEAAAEHTMLDGLGASGWYLCCILMRMSTDAFVLNSSSMGAPGVDEVRWLLPVRPDDELSLRATVLDTRASRSRPDMGFVRFEFELFDGHGRRVMTLTTSLMMGGGSRARHEVLGGHRGGRARRGRVLHLHHRWHQRLRAALR